MSFNEWKKYKLADELEVKYGKDHKALGEGTIPVYGSGGIMRYAEKAIYDKVSILIPRKGTLNNLFYIEKPFWTVDTMFWTKINTVLLDPKFLFYQLSIIDYSSMNVGSAVPSMTVPILNNLQVNIPTKKVQKQIASILSSLDDKIELNRQTNQTLEAIAQTLFKEMCLPKGDELPEGWRVEKLGDCIRIVNGYAFKGMDFIDKGVPVIKIKNVKAGKVILNNLSYVSKEVANNAQRFRINKNDLLITMSGNRIDGTPETWVGKVGIFHREGEYLLNQRVSKLISNNEEVLSRYFLCQLLSNEEFQYHFISNATSSGGQANISPELINNIEITIPPNLVMKHFNEVAKDVYEKIFLNEEEVQTLTTLRDSLLPKLMKGEIELMSNN